eukprot:m51a1_g1386 hypothetical protein (890) ;mRNA; f:460067-463130
MYDLCFDCLSRRIAEEIGPVLNSMTQERLSDMITTGRITCPTNSGHMLQVRSCPEILCRKCIGAVAMPGVQCCECPEYVRCVQCMYLEIEARRRTAAHVAEHHYRGVACPRHKCPASVVELSHEFEFDCLLCGKALVVLCSSCADYVVFQRLHARQFNPSRLPDCTVDLSLEVGRYAFWCSVCEEYFTPDDVWDSRTPLVWFSDHTTCFACCLKCSLANLEGRSAENTGGATRGKTPSVAVAARLVHGLGNLRSRAERTEYKRMEDFVMKQELKWERGLQTESLLDATCISKTPGAWHELEEVVHNSGELPPPIVYEIEVALAFKERLQELDPFIRQFLTICQWPLHTALRLVTLCNAYSLKYDQSEAVWKAQSQYLREWSLGILNKLDKMEYIRNLVLNPRPCGIPRSLLHLALEAGHEDFLAHRLMHTVVLEKWNSPIRTDESFSASQFILAQFVLVVISLASLVLLEKEKSLWHLLDTFSISPKMTYKVHLAFYIGFLVAASANTAVRAQRQFTILQGTIFFWVIGMLVGEITQALRRGSSYFRSTWNLFDAAHIVLYVAALVVKAIASRDTGDPSADRLLETYDCILSLAIIASYTRGLYLMLPSRRVGMLLVSFGRMLRNVAMFLVFAIMVIFAFTFALAKIYNVVDAQRDVANNAGDQRAASEASSLILFVKIVKTFGFGINNMPSLDPSSFMIGRYIVAVLFVLAFMTVTTIVLINLLIAIMNDTFNAVEGDLADLHRATVSDLVVEFGEISPVPPPLNLVVLALPWAIALVVWAGRSLPSPGPCGCSWAFGCFHEASPWSSGQGGQRGSNFCYSAYMHTRHYMRAKHLNRALLAESAVIRKLGPLLREEPAEHAGSRVVEKIGTLRTALETMCLGSGTSCV